MLRCNASVSGGALVHANTVLEPGLVEPDREKDPPLTFGLTLLEGHGSVVFGDQTPSTWEAGGTTHLGLVGAQGTGEAGQEAVVGVLARETLTWEHKSMRPVLI